jgi:hypothetical protein
VQNSLDELAKQLHPQGDIIHPPLTLCLLQCEVGDSLATAHLTLDEAGQVPKDGILS